MESDVFWVAMALVLVFEGLFPFISPAAWRRTFAQLLQLRDGQVRFIALISILSGLLMIWFMTP